jgi:hypothetical protein
MMPDFVQVNFALHGAIMQIIGDSLLGRARCSDEHGLLPVRRVGGFCPPVPAR